MRTAPRGVGPGWALGLALWAVAGATHPLVRAAEAPVPAGGAEPAATVLFAERTTRLASVRVEGDDLAIPLADFAAVTGLDLKPQGICQGEFCLPLGPETKRELFSTHDGAEWISLTALARRLDQPLEAVREERVWSFGEVPAVVAGGLGAGLAPEFVLPDRQGRPVRLADFRGKKVLVLTWASW